MLLGVFNLIIPTYSFLFFPLSPNLLSSYTCSFILFLYFSLGLHISFLFLLSHFFFLCLHTFFPLYMLIYSLTLSFSWFSHLFFISSFPLFFFLFFFFNRYMLLYSLAFIFTPYFLASLDMYFKPHRSWHPTLKSTILEY